MTKISIVAAIANNNAIGKDNKLLWHLPNDLKFFKNYTLGKVIIMGRNTFESIGSKPLPRRINAVITQRQLDVENVLTFKSLDTALTHFQNSEEVCIVGGARIYEEALEKATDLVLTKVEAEPEADVFFPEVNWSNWTEQSKETYAKDEKHQYDYSFLTYIRRK